MIGSPARSSRKSSENPAMTQLITNAPRQRPNVSMRTIESGVMSSASIRQAASATPVRGVKLRRKNALAARIVAKKPSLRIGDMAAVVCSVICLPA